MSNEEHNCPFTVSYSKEEQEAMEWLKRTLEAIMEKPEHRSHEKAKICYGFIDKLFHQNARTHAVMHALITLGVIDRPETVEGFEEMSSEEAEQKLAEIGFLSQTRGKA